jgi:hypothetical protein
VPARIREPRQRPAETPKPPSEAVVGDDSE